MPNAEPSPRTLRTPDARWPQDMTMSSTPWRRSQSSMKTMNGRSTSGTTGLGTVVVSGRRRVPSPPARMSACTGLRPADGARRLHVLALATGDRRPPDALIGEAGVAHLGGLEEVASVHEQIAAHRRGELAEVDVAELRPLRHEHDRVGAVGDVERRA